MVLRKGGVYRSTAAAEIIDEVAVLVERSGVLRASR